MQTRPALNRVGTQECFVNVAVLCNYSRVHRYTENIHSSNIFLYIDLQKLFLGNAQQKFDVFFP